jgi:hypothetical protein
MRQAAQHSHGGGLPRSVWSEETEDCSGLDLKGKIPHGMHVPETLAQVLEHNHWFGHDETLLR